MTLAFSDLAIEDPRWPHGPDAAQSAPPEVLEVPLHLRPVAGAYVGEAVAYPSDAGSNGFRDPVDFDLAARAALAAHDAAGRA
jgi:hypothetical protein